MCQCKRFDRALTLYKSALDAIKYEKTEVVAGQGDRYRTVLYSNMAATQLKLNELSDALTSCNEVTNYYYREKIYILQ